MKYQVFLVLDRCQNRKKANRRTRCKCVTYVLFFFVINQSTLCSFLSVNGLNDWDSFSSLCTLLLLCIRNHRIASSIQYTLTRSLFLLIRSISILYNELFACYGSLKSHCTISSILSPFMNKIDIGGVLFNGINNVTSIMSNVLLSGKRRWKWGSMQSSLWINSIGDNCFYARHTR